MSDTPKTDAVEFSAIQNICDNPDAVYAVPAAFARELERENAALRGDKARLDKMESMLRESFRMSMNGKTEKSRALLFEIPHGETLRQFIDDAG